MRLLQARTGWSVEQVRATYAASGASNFRQFVLAVLASRELGLDTPAVLQALKTMYLRDALVSAGATKERAHEQIRSTLRSMVAESKVLRASK